ncbi:MAG TPA: bifunctional hydroxymethylpyrimidine kinase/phosphomethylpyrimidine kinase, partial [Roseococcus sp.]|nr:bifunctional hydroxymethylpyrimidine kinase/phosphomethylpyrimidine kinase [Roseococcus sp.]
MKGRVLICAGSDSGGGAGIQADIKAVTSLGGFAMTAVTALTAQNTLGVQDVMGVEPGFIRRQILSVLDDLGCDAVKTGMLHDAATIEAVCDE